jgi:hypothetical protein
MAEGRPYQGRLLFLSQGRGRERAVKGQARGMDSSQQAFQRLNSHRYLFPQWFPVGEKYQCGHYSSTLALLQDDNIILLEASKNDIISKLARQSGRITVE